MIWIDYKDATPIYEQVVSNYKKLIVRGVLKPDEKMPSVRTLAMELSINPNTIQKAYAQLERDGYIYTVKGRGNFVAAGTQLKDAKQAEIMEQLKAVVKDAKESGVDLQILADYIEGQKKGGADQ